MVTSPRLHTQLAVAWVDQHVLQNVAVGSVDRDNDGIGLRVSPSVPQGPVNRRIEESIRQSEQLAPSQAGNNKSDALDRRGAAPLLSGARPVARIEVDADAV